MTKLQPGGWFRFALARSRHAGRVEKLGLSTLAGIIVTFCIMPALASATPIFISLLSFDGTDGRAPEGRLVQATDGNFYGTTEAGGTSDGGTVFKITPGGTLTTLHSFCYHPDCTDGVEPAAGLVQATNGNFYGTTTEGGANGDGTFFQINTGGKLSRHSFDGTDGFLPVAGLVQAINGNFYGTTAAGGANRDGTVFKITPGGTLTTLHSFDGTDGAVPFAGLVQATDGNLYGTTLDGGAHDAGMVFRITSGGMLTTLRSFDHRDGAYPSAGLVQATDGNLYGTTEAGGANRDGTVFKITPGGALTTLYSFCAQTDCNDGAYPSAGLVQATDGNLYGTTARGGANGDYGTVFKITPGGALTTLHSFDDADGNGPLAELVQATNGNLYGTTGFGGTSGDGTVFSLNVGLGPFVETRPVAGGPGRAVIILGNNLTGATGVSFNGTAATFTVMSSSQITTTVPDGATTGPVAVTTPGGSLTSNVNFRVP